MKQEYKINLDSWVTFGPVEMTRHSKHKERGAGKHSPVTTKLAPLTFNIYHYLLCTTNFQ